MKKRNLAFKAAAVLLSLTLLTACGNSDNDGNKDNTTPAVTSEADKPTDTVTDTPAVTSTDPATTDTPVPTDADDAKDDPEILDPEEGSRVYGEYKKIEIDYKPKDLTASYDPTDVTYIEFSNDGIAVSGKKDVPVSSINGRQKVLIDKKGTYVISGECSNGQIVVEADKEKDVRIILNGLKLTCPDSAAIYEKECDKFLITLVDGTENVISATTNFVYEDAEKKNPDACIFAKDDLVINGNGSLKVTSSVCEGIHSTDSLKIVSGTIDVETTERAIRAKKYIAIKDGNITIKSEEDSIRTTKDDDVAFGHIVIEGGNINIYTNSEGIQATGTVQITGGTLDISAKGQKSNAIKTDKMLYIVDAKVTVDSKKDLKASGGIIAGADTVITRK